ncbi:3-oxoacyl-[acyl-carrier protein] reductase [Sulfuriferula multivorans]|uniref:3-oxoacyl-[acyl-carrier protein] reductase n=1 Tax=Sulfuriferula multivorans TaxID=1559896 RepID=A0A401J9P1_9PROT|nr:SDR family oxidoreductase [Sulfuriferula multivorans]GBL44284.1 3-oxoacyl-[acyl-carrier protein] reductase [Sulfuriferula multivorans]
MKNRVALVTGASRGIGAAIAAALARAGVHVLTPSRTEMDLAVPESIERYVDTIEGPIDILVNNAGINFLAGIDELDSATLNATLQINLVAPLQLTRLVAERMKANRFGRIVNLSSIWSIVSKERRMAYAASKSAINGVTRTLALELGPHGILVNAIAPGYVNTELTRQNNSAEQIQAISDTIPLQRLAEPAEIAEMVAFLCSGKNSYMTGQVLVVDGGYVCR